MDPTDRQLDRRRRRQLWRRRLRWRRLRWRRLRWLRRLRRMWSMIMIPASTAAGSDRFGLGWRRELAMGILSHLDRIDVVEVMADDFFDAPRRGRRSLRTLAARTSGGVHGVALGVGASAAGGWGARGGRRWSPSGWTRSPGSAPRSSRNSGRSIWPSSEAAASRSGI